MFQDFDGKADPTVGRERIGKLRTRLAKLGLDGFLVPRGDEHRGEYVPPSAERLRWLTGFSGSAGMAAVLREKAALFVDGRYTVQARQEVDTSLLEIRKVPEARLSEFLVESLGRGARVGFDPRLHSLAEIEGLEDILKPRGIELEPVGKNLVDGIWRDQPKPPLGQVAPQGIEHAGRSAAAKVAELQQVLAKAGEDAAVLTLTDSVAWLFNIRGTDVKHTPVALAFAIVPAKGTPELFIERKKIGDNVRGALTGDAAIKPHGAFGRSLEALGTRQARVRLDPSSANRWIADRLTAAGAVISRASDPCQLPKARKNEVEVAGAKAAHERDGVAVARFLAWLDQEAGKGGVDEIAAASKLEACRAATGELKEISFDTIAGSGPNGAIVHYRPLVSTSRRLGQGELFLLDSGAQYLDGTTDITRTIAIGEPTAEMRQRFTLVLKGHIAIATLRFPKGTSGLHIDAFARRALWEAGLDFDHGTGHGVGSYLSVHEGPQSIGKGASLQALEPGMIVSNEPGFYKEGAYGIRIENLLLVGEPQAIAGGERPMMAFETLTLAPIDLRLVDASLLEERERRWLNAYHARVRAVLGPKLPAAERRWLDAATAPVE
jgi:Xaa-Pro aminopeptidase